MFWIFLLFYYYLLHNYCKLFVPFMATICWNPELCRQTQCCTSCCSVWVELLELCQGRLLWTHPAALAAVCFPDSVSVLKALMIREDTCTNTSSSICYNPHGLSTIETLSWNLISVKDSSEKFSRFMCCSVQQLFDAQLRNKNHHCHQKFFWWISEKYFK